MLGTQIRSNKRLPRFTISGVATLGLTAASSGVIAASSDALGTSVSSQSSAAPIALTLKVPLILPGVGLDVTGALNRYLDARAGYSDLPYTYHKSGTLSGSDGGFRYTGKSEVSAWNVLLDYKPFGGTFRVTAGVYGPRIGLKVTGAPTDTDTFTINGDPYSTADVKNLSGKVGWYNVTPYVGLGRDGFNKASADYPVLLLV